MAWGRLILLVLAISISGIAAWVFQPLVHDNKDAINTVITIFSILAGFLLAVITFVADPTSKDWKQLQLDKGDVNRRLTRHRILFYLYLVTLGLALSLFLLPDQHAIARLWLERFFVGSSVFVFLVSFTLPSSLSALLMERYESKLKEDMPKVLK